MISLLEKFESVQVPSQGLLTVSDIEYCTNTEKEYRHGIRHLDLCLEGLKRLRDDQHALSLTKDTLEEWVDIFGYDPETEISNITDLKKSLTKGYVDKIIHYFNTIYKLELKGFVPKKSPAGGVSFDIFWKDITDWVLSQTAGDLAGATVTTLIKNLHNEVGRFSSLVLKGNTIHFIRCLRLIENSSIWGARLEYSGSADVRLTDKLICYFENLSIDFKKVIEKIYESLDRKVDKFPLTLELSGFKKITALKLYKNGRVDFIFPSEALANEFYFLFQLHTIKTDN